MPHLYRVECGLISRGHVEETTSPIDQGQMLYASLLHELEIEGASHADVFAGRTHEQMMDDARMERWREKGLGGE